MVFLTIKSNIFRLPNDGLRLTMLNSVPKGDIEAVKDEYFRDLPRKTIDELLEATEVFFCIRSLLLSGKISYLIFSLQVERCKIKCMVDGIDTDYSWYYFSCLRCNKIAYKVPKKENDLAKQKKSLFWCNHCKEEVTKVTPKQYSFLTKKIEEFYVIVIIIPLF